MRASSNRWHTGMDGFCEHVNPLYTLPYGSFAAQMHRTFVYKPFLELLKNHILGQIGETFLTRSGAREGQTRGVSFGI
jgi:hypothetical protein